LGNPTSATVRRGVVGERVIVIEESWGSWGRGEAGEEVFRWGK
jgi:hypothetical protein